MMSDGMSGDDEGAVVRGRWRRRGVDWALLCRAVAIYDPPHISINTTTTTIINHNHHQHHHINTTTNQ